MPEVTASTDLMSPLNLFMQADIVVKIVMVGLLLASVWTWAIIFTHAIRLKRRRRMPERARIRRFARIACGTRRRSSG